MAPTRWGITPMDGSSRLTQKKTGSDHREVLAYPLRGALPGDRARGLGGRGCTPI